MTEGETNDVMLEPPSARAEAAGISPRVYSLADLSWLVGGYIEAWDRYRAASDGGKPARETFRPLFEALNWTVSIDEYLRSQGEPDDELRRALRFVRNLVHHQWADALEERKTEVTSSISVAPGLKLAVGGYSTEWFWKPLNRLPPRPPNRRDEQGARAYDDLLAGHEARQALDQLADTLRQRLATPDEADMDI